MSGIAQAQAVRPGIWQADTQFRVFGFHLPATHEQQCVTADQAKDLRTTLGQQLAGAGCSITDWAVQREQIQLALQCDKNGLKASGQLRGTLDDQNYDLNGEAKGSYNHIPARAKISLQGHWVKDCPR